MALTALPSLTAKHVARTGRNGAAKPVPSIAQLPLSFEANRGQWDSHVSFVTRGAGHTLWLSPTEVTMSLRAGSGKSVAATPRAVAASAGSEHRANVRMHLSGANPQARLRPEARQQGYANYLLGNDPKKWRTHVPTYSQVRAAGIYPGVDLIYYGTQHELEYDFRVQPGADPSRIRLAYDATSKLEVAADGDLLIHAGDAVVRQHQPVVYQERNGRREPVTGAYQLADAHTVRFQLGAYDRDRTLVIDPVLTYSGYLGGNDDDKAGKITQDAQGNAYVTGSTISSNFPQVLSPGGTAFGGHGTSTSDAFVTKVNPSGTALVYSTYFGGSNIDSGFGITLDGSGDIVVGGNTRSTDFPRVKPIQPLGANGSTEDGFVTVLAPDGQSIIYSTVVKGTTGVDTIWSVAADSSNNVYACGWTQGGIPMSANAFQAGYGGGSYDAFLYKIAPPTGGGNASLAYGSYLGGGKDDYFSDVVVDNAGNATVVGQTASPGFPTTVGAQQTAYGGGPYDVVVSTFATTQPTPANTLSYSTFLGGNQDDAGNGIARAPGNGGDTWITGYAGANFPLMSAYQGYQGSQDAFLVHLDSTLHLLSSTYVGGSGTDTGWSVGVDGSGNPTVAGWTTGGLTTASAFQSTYGGGADDVFLAQYNSNATVRNYLSYLGGPGDDQVRGLSVDSAGNVAISGLTTSKSGLATANSFGATPPPVLQFPKITPPYDAFVAKIGITRPPLAVADTYAATQETLLSVPAAGVLANDSDPDGDAITAVLSTAPTHAASFTLNANGSFTYTGATGFFGTDTFKYYAQDTHSAQSLPVTVTLNVAKINHAPVAVADSYVATENSTLFVPVKGLLANDTDADGDPLTVVNVVQPMHGSVALNGGGSFNYTPATNYYGPDSFTYQASDGVLLSSPATVSLSVTRVDLAPVAQNQTVTLPSNTPSIASSLPITLMATDPDSYPGALTYSIVTGPAHGVLTGTPPNVTYTPTLNYIGADSFRFKANDTEKDSGEGLVSITVTNRAPVTLDDHYVIKMSGVLSPDAAHGVLLNDYDPEGRTLIVTLNGAPAHALSFNLSQDGSFTYTPLPGYTGPDTFTYTATDPGGKTSTAVVRITVDTPPVAVNDSFTVHTNTTQNPHTHSESDPGVLGNDTDVDGDPLTVAAASTGTFSSAQGGTVHLYADGSFTYTAPLNYLGTDSFTYKANDGYQDSLNTATVTLTVGNTAPVAYDDYAEVNQGHKLDVPASGVLGNDGDADGDTLVVDSTYTGSHTTSHNGSLILRADGSFCYTPDSDYYGDDTFTYKANDGLAQSNEVTVTIHVNALPVANGGSADTTVNVATTVNIVATDPDSGPSGLTYYVDTNTAHGVLVNNQDGSFGYTPNMGYTGTDSFTYHVNDGMGDSNTATVSITIRSVPTTPPALWYNGDDNHAGSYTNRTRTLINIAPKYDVPIEDFDVPSGGWKVQKVFSNNITTDSALNVTQAVVSIRGFDTKLHLPIPTFVLFQASASMQKTGTTVLGGTTYTQYLLSVGNLNINLPQGHYWLSVEPVIPDSSNSFAVWTSGLNAIGTPAGNNANGYRISHNGLLDVDHFSALNKDVSMGVAGFALTDPR